MFTEATLRFAEPWAQTICLLNKNNTWYTSILLFLGQRLGRVASDFFRFCTSWSPSMLVYRVLFLCMKLTQQEFSLTFFKLYLARNTLHVSKIIYQPDFGQFLIACVCINFISLSFRSTCT